jgi:hypothetical protein
MPLAPAELERELLEMLEELRPFALAFYHPLVNEDVDHSARTLEMVVRYADTDDSQHKVRDAVRRTAMGHAAVPGRKPSRLPDAIVDTLRRRARAAGQRIAPG